MKSKILILLILITFNSCNKGKIEPIVCITDFIVSNASESDIESFVQLEGVDIWRGWSNFTSDFSEEYQSIEDCEINEYLSKNHETSLGELKGQILFVFSVHCYLKEGKINRYEVQKEALKLLD